jgi:hypothetical protein
MKTIKEGKNTNGVLDKVYIAYGSSEYSPNKFKPVDLKHWRSTINNKPFGGLWASPIDSKWGWKDWCQAEEWKTESLNTYFTFTLAPGANIYVIDNEKDLMSVSTFRSEYTSTLSIDFADLINNGYDGIYVTDNAARKFRCSTIYGISDLSSWDCESICIFNKDVIIPKVQKEKNMKTESKIIKLTETKLNQIIKKSISDFLINEDYVKYPKYRSPYDDKAESNGITQPVKKGVDLYDIRARLFNVSYALKNEKYDDAKKQLFRLYKLVDAMINQGF